MASITASQVGTSKTIQYSWTAEANTWWNVDIDGVQVDSGRGDTSGSGTYTVSSYGSHTVALYVNKTGGGSEYPSTTVTLVEPPPVTYSCYAAQHNTANIIEWSWSASALVPIGRVAVDGTYIKTVTNRASDSGLYTVSYGTHTVTFDLDGHTGTITVNVMEPTPPPPTTGAYIWDGTEWKPATPYVWDGSAWVQATANIWNGSQWKS